MSLASSPPPSNASACPPKGTHWLTFQPVTGEDTMRTLQGVLTRFQCVTVMKEYSEKSLEMLRLEYYQSKSSRREIATQTPAKVPLSGFSAMSLSSSSFSSSPSASLPRPKGTQRCPFQAVTGVDTTLIRGEHTNICTRHQCITVMEAYSGKSLEMLRFEDYQKMPVNPKSSSSASASDQADAETKPADTTTSTAWSGPPSLSASEGEVPATNTVMTSNSERKAASAAKEQKAPKEKPVVSTTANVFSFAAAGPAASSNGDATTFSWASQKTPPTAFTLRPSSFAFAGGDAVKSEFAPYVSKKPRVSIELSAEEDKRLLNKFKLKPEVKESGIVESLICPGGCNTVFRGNILVSKTGESLCRSCYKTKREEGGSPAFPSPIAMNRALMKIVRLFFDELVSCKHAVNGCDFSGLSGSEIEEHQRKLCKFRKVVCPLCGSSKNRVVFSDLEEHLSKEHPKVLHSVFNWFVEKKGDCTRSIQTWKQHGHRMFAILEQPASDADEGWIKVWAVIAADAIEADKFCALAQIGDGKSSTSSVSVNMGVISVDEVENFESKNALGLTGSHFNSNVQVAISVYLKESPPGPRF